jgi:hypothetical protein
MSERHDTVVPQAKDALDKMKFQIAGEVGVTLSGGYNGDIRAKDAGRIGGQMVRRMIQYAEDSLKNTNGNLKGF